MNPFVNELRKLREPLGILSRSSILMKVFVVIFAVRDMIRYQG